MALWNLLLEGSTDSQQFWKLPESAEDVFSLFSPADIRRARDNSLHNIETLLTSLISRLIALSHLPAFPDPELAPAKEALNCIRVITRILPFIYESDHLESWEDKFFWQRRRRKLDNGNKHKPEVLFDGSNSDGVEQEEKVEEESYEHIKPLGEELIDHLIDLLFYINFTVPRLDNSKKKVTYAIWQTGVGCNRSMQSSKEMESNRSEILRLLLTMSNTVSIKGVKALTYVTTCPDKQIVLSLLCSQLNTCNKRFRSSVIGTERGTEFAVLVLYYALEHKSDPAKQGVVRMCVFILQTLSTEPDFGKSLNRKFTGQETLPLSVRIPDFTGTYADYLVTGKLDAIYPALLATINNVAPYLQNLDEKSSTKIIQLFASISLRNGSFDNVRSPQSTRTPSLSNVPEEDGTFTIGDDEDSEEDEREPMATPSHSSSSNQASQSPSRSSSIDEPLPTQLRGMSEKARGKMPANQSAFSRQSSSTSLNSHFSAAIMSPTIGFSPSAHWIDSWLPTLPLHTILTLLASSPPGTDRGPSDELPPQIDPSPPRVHLFSWTPLALGWYESLLWGFIFASEMVVQKGTVGVWNATNIRLFRVEQMAASGPSLMKPMGAVDAVGSNLVQRIGRMGVRTDRAPSGGTVRDV
ncbi:MAG: hypothetical protein L6R41_001596 [Letrouitia leprolyta]|nr:MAG: hypothetical protein L6R41_001596 [Letrouitia leprolyta]